MKLTKERLAEIKKGRGPKPAEVIALVEMVETKES